MFTVRRSGILNRYHSVKDSWNTELAQCAPINMIFKTYLIGTHRMKLLHQEFVPFWYEETHKGYLKKCDFENLFFLGNPVHCIYDWHIVKLCNLDKD
jgi:hypothetical protein